ncbi:LysR family transcriptional regulator [Streptomyces sp. NPDC002790]|uniref:LysR family transcriptional regulator n=1 Tax=Streptomyces sp. NPDC002790 TaxID=3154431 RepID=UPI00332443EA
MEVRQASHFLAIADHGTMGRAAEHLHLSQPALSQSLVALEREVSAVLFERFTRGMRLTTAGEALLQPARRLVDAGIRAKAAIDGIKDSPRGEFHIAAMPALAAVPVSQWIARFRERYPKLSVHFGPFTGEEPIERFLDRGPVELVISHYDNATPSSIQKFSAGMQGMVVAFPPNMVVPDAPLITIEQLAHYPLIVSPPNTSMRRVVERAFADANQVLTVAVETQLMDSFASLVAAGAGCALLPLQIVETLHRLGVTTRHLDIPITRTYSLLYRKDQLSYAGQEFARMVLSENGS